MKGFSKNVVAMYATAIILSSFIVTISEAKTARSKLPQESSKVANTYSASPPSNVFYSVAKSLFTEAMSQVKESARRNPRLGFNITMLLPPSIANLTSNSSLPLPLIGNLLGTTTQLGVIGLKGGILGIKAAIVQAIVLVLFIVFLLAGIAYFACNIGIISCSNLGGSLSNLGGGLGGASLAGGNQYSRAGYDYHNLQRSTSAIYNAIDDGQKKYS